MKGRLEHKIKVEDRIKTKIANGSDVLKKYYYSLNQKTHATKNVYINHVIRYLEYCFNDLSKATPSKIKELDVYSIEQYVSDISYYNKGDEIKELSGTSKAGIYSALNSFFDFLCNHDYISVNPMTKGIQRPKIDDTEITYLTPEEVNKVEDVILGEGSGTTYQKSQQKKWKLRDYLLFRIPVVTGLRVTALEEINIEDISFKNSTIRVTEKGNITKNIYIDDKTKQYIIKWLVQRKDIVDNNTTGPLFISKNKTRMSTTAIESVIKKHTKEAVPYKHITPHKLRSTCGTNLYQSKKDIYLVADVLGHKSTSPTKRYAKIFTDDRKDAIKTIANLYDDLKEE